MNRRDVFKSIGAALVGAGVENSTIQAVDKKPEMVVIKITDELVNVTQAEMEKIKDFVNNKCKQAGWDIPVLVLPAGLSMEVYPKESINVTIPPDTIVEQIGNDYTVIYPVGKKPR